MIFDRETVQADWLKLNKLSQELRYLKYGYSGDGLMGRYLAIALGEVERAKEHLAKRIEEDAELTKIKRDFEK